MGEEISVGAARFSGSDRSPAEGRNPLPPLVGRSKAIRDVIERIEKLRRSSAPVVIEGRTGTGKEVVARRLHGGPPFAARGRYVPVNCGALSESTLESELFGHEVGAFTGAVRLHRGLLEQAHEGTLFLDELGDAPLFLQVRLLRVLEDGSMTRKGGERLIPVRFRLVVGTQTPLEELLAAGRLREDFYHRLGAIRIQIPPLAQRREDIPDLIAHFIDLYGRELGRPPLALSRNCEALFLAYAWPGNVRELAHEIEHLYTLDPSGIVGPEVLSPKFLRNGREPATGADDKKTTRRWIARCAIDKADGNSTAAAQSLGIGRSTLYRWRRG